MLAKLFEVRDRATFIPVIAVHLAPTTPIICNRNLLELPSDHPAELYLLNVLGYSGGQRTDFTPYILLARASCGDAHYDPNHWMDRTMKTAHKYITENWIQINSGDVVDVEFILGETTEPKKSQRHEQFFV